MISSKSAYCNFQNGKQALGNRQVEWWGGLQGESLNAGRKLYFVVRYYVMYAKIIRKMIHLLNTCEIYKTIEYYILNLFPMLIK